MFRRRLLSFLFHIVVMFSLTLGTAACASEAGTGPRIWIDSPGDGASFPSGTIVTVISHAYAREGVAEVVLSINGEAYRRDTPPSPGTAYVQINQDWQAAAGGIYAVQVVAYDTKGQASNPETITVEVTGTSPMPVVGCPSPVGGGPTPVSCPPEVIGCPSPVGGGPTPVSCLPIVNTCPSPIGGGPTPVTCVTPVITVTPTTPPTITPTIGLPPPAETIIQFWADPAGIQAGACTNVRWHVENAQRVIFGGSDQPFDGSYEACLCEDERYKLTVVHQDGTEEQRKVDISVEGDCVTPEIPQPAPDTTPPPVPNPVAPANGAELTCASTQTVEWTPVKDDSGISTYFIKMEVEVKKGQWQSAGGYTATGKTVNVNVNSGGIYRWMVRAQDKAGNISDWSAPSYFSCTIG